MRQITLITFTAALLALLLLAGCSPAASPVPTATPTVLDQAGPLAGDPAAAGPLPALDPAQVAQGEALYATYCAACHGAELEGQPEWKQPNEDGSFRAPPHDESGHTWHHGDETLQEAIRLGGGRFDAAAVGGTSAMPAYDGVLTEAEMTAVLAYIKSHWTDETRSIQWQATLQERAWAEEE